ncbi:MAG TPA: hypothetical protein VHR97_06645 [Candidatus Baltobacteraceae bacterium]|jgi:hypothetical protein|nr:hypothetical protein [Candidatus Baltobacteraceae bacterium]
MNGRYIFAALMLGFAVSGCSDGSQSQQMGVSAGGQGLQSAAQRSLGRDSAGGYRVDSQTISFDPQESKRVVLNCPKFPSAPAISGGYYIVPDRSPDLVVSGSYPGEASGVVKWYVRVENKSKDKAESAAFYVVCDTR